jgi:glycosyltransferase involved in cell wall biosynthesis
MHSVIIDKGNATTGGGIGEYVTSLSGALRDYHSGSIEVRDSGTSLDARSFRPLNRLVYLYRLHGLRSRRYNGASVVHFANIYVPRPLEGVPYLGTVHDLDPIMLPGAHTRRYVRYFTIAAKMTVERSTLVVTQTSAVRNEVLDLYGISPEKVVVGGNGLNGDFATAVNRATKTEPEIPTMMFVGQINRKKNVAWLVRTFVSGVRRGSLPRMRLILAGRAGYGFSEVSRELQTAGDLVIWKNGVGRDELVRLMCSSTMIVVPSLREGFGRPLLEAMYCGKPIVASRIPSTLEVAAEAASYFSIDNAEDFYASIGDVLAKNNDDLRRKAAIRQLKKYSWNHLANVYRDIYVKAATMR